MSERITYYTEDLIPSRKAYAIPGTFPREYAIVEFDPEPEEKTEIISDLEPTIDYLTVLELPHVLDAWLKCRCPDCGVTFNINLVKFVKFHEQGRKITCYPCWKGKAA